MVLDLTSIFNKIYEEFTNSKQQVGTLKALVLYENLSNDFEQK